MKYKEVESNPNFVSIEEKILDFWDKNKIFRQSIERLSESNCFVFYDGPPFANGLPHYGHLLTGFIKDAFARYQTMQGRRVERRFGWDCHGLPAEIGAEKELDISGRIAIEKFGIEKFNNHCRSSVIKYTAEWEKYVNRQARWVDFCDNYKTMDMSFMESVMWAFKQLYDKGLVYESVRVVPYSWACETPLSNFETRIDNSYRRKVDKSVTVAFELLKKPKFAARDISKCKLLAWTTTPWTLPSNLALAVGRDMEYVSAIMNNELYIFARSYIQKFADHCQQNNISYSMCNTKFRAEDLVYLSYKPLFDYFASTKNAFRVLVADYITEEGTGVVHIAPGFGEDDFFLCQKYNIEAICPVDSGGRFTTSVSDLTGMHVFDTNDIIIKKLKGKGLWFKTEQYIHNYPHCWRTDTPLIYRVMPSWYIAVTKFKGRMVELNKSVNWVPQHVRDGQFGKWLESAHDWSISRNRFWGTPIPVWKSDNPKYPRVDVYGSIVDLERDFNTKIEDLHLPFIDSLMRSNPDDPTGKSTMRRVSGVFDCWFESGSMPFAQTNYPFKNKKSFKPADFVTEYIAQTRGWFYTLFVLSTALFDRPPFKNCICHGVILDIQGQKLSKRLNNYADPMEVFNKYGSDSLRFLMLSSSVVCGGNLLLDKEGNMIREVLKSIIKPMWNSYHFFAMYANVDGIEAKICDEFKSTIDRYIIAKCFEAVTNIKNSMDLYNAQNACKAITDFFEVLNNWYIRRSRNRFWKSEMSQDKIDAYNVLYTVFYYVLRAASPLLPLITEAIWQGLRFKERSIHLTDFPERKRFDKKLIDEMDLVQNICNSALSIRNAHKVRIRQPLNKMTIYHKSISNLSDEYKDIIKDEVNVKTLEIRNNVKEIASVKLKLNFFLLGKRVPNKVKDIIQYVEQKKWNVLEDEQLFVGEYGSNYYVLKKEEYEILLQTDDVFSCVFDDNKGIAMLDIEINNELLIEGLARDLVRIIQEARKQADFHISDRIEVIVMTSNNDFKNAIKKWGEYIKDQTLSTHLTVNVQLEKNKNYITYLAQGLTVYISKLI